MRLHASTDIDFIGGGLYQRKNKLMVEEETSIGLQDESDDETNVLKCDQNVPLLSEELPTTSTSGTMKQVIVIRDDIDSGISESASEESSILKELPNGSDQPSVKKESLISVIIQIFFPYLIAGFGMMLAGFLLDYVQHWKVFLEVSELYILVPALLGLKGNLEMTLASRLSTAANLGQFNSWKSRWLIAWGNLCLIQGQALLVAFVATLAATILGLFAGHPPSIKEVFLLCGSSMLAASLASLSLGILIIIIVMTSHYLTINPDNVATPIAASLGDLITLTLLSFIAHGLYELKDETTLISGILCLVMFMFIPIMVWLAYKNDTSRSALYAGWIPVLSAMIISSIGGLILKEAVGKLEGIAIYTPIINGMGGNLVAVQASRISTSLHMISSPGKQPPNNSYLWQGLCGTFWSSRHARTAALLVTMVIPGSLLFLIIINYADAGHTSLSPRFLVTYLILAIIQVVILLTIADWLVHYLFWRLGFDPDNIAIPFLTALGDLLGTGLLAAGFVFLYMIGDKDQDVGE